jgi:hypothetical protein
MQVLALKRGGVATATFQRNSGLRASTPNRGVVAFKPRHGFPAFGTHVYSLMYGTPSMLGALALERRTIKAMIAAT